MMDCDLKALKQLVEQAVKTAGETAYQESPFDSKSHPLAFIRRLQPVVEETVQKSMEMDVKVTLTVADATGQMVYCYRMPGCILAGLEISNKKAYTSVAMGEETIVLQKLCQPGADLYQLETITDGKIVTFGGGVPVYDTRETLIGAVGVSGAPKSSQDHELASFFAYHFQQTFFSDEKG
ncbi:MAG: heme-binding protein [Sporolactobacillus sp.]